MNTNQAETGTIERPRLWRLALQLDREALRAVVWSTVEESSMLQFSLPLDPTLPAVKALEKAVYAAPVLLSDFGAVDVVVRTCAYSLLPGAPDDDFCAEAARYLHLGDDDTELACRADRVEGADATVVWVMEAAVANFLARTFRNPAVVCHITPLLRYFSRKSLLGNSGKIYAHLYQSGGTRAADIVSFTHTGAPAIAVTHTVPTDDDAVYYILGALQLAGLDASADEILLCGTPDLRDAVMPALRRYAASVMPVIFPSAAFRNGREALNAPFPLVILPLCE